MFGRIAICFFLITATANAMAEDRKCDKELSKLLSDGRCLQLIDGQIFIDGQKQKVGLVTGPADMKHATLPAAPAGVERIVAVYDKAILNARFRDHAASFNLPQFYVVDLASGNAALASTLPESFAQFAKDNGSDPKDLASAPHVERASLLDKLMAVSRNADGSPLRTDQFGAKKYAAFQLWADWCTGCMQEASELSALLKQHPMPELAWIALETDPMKSMSINPPPAAHDSGDINGDILKFGTDDKPVAGTDGKPVEE